MNTLQTQAFLVILTLVLSTGLYCQRLANGSWTYQLVKSENVKKIVKFWHFNPNFQEEEFPKIAVQNEQIYWLNGSKPRTLPLPSAFVRSVSSRVGKYLGLMSISEEAKEKVDDRIFHLQIFSTTGEKLYEIKRTQHYDDSIPSVAISDEDGSVVLGKNTVGNAWFYHRTGSLNLEIDLFDDDSYGLERVLQMDFTKDGRNLVILASKRGASPIGSGVPNPSGEPYLFLFELDGSELWRRPLAEFNAGQTVIAPNGQYIVASSYTTDFRGNIKKRTFIFDHRGKEIKSLDLLFRMADFSPDSKYLLLAERTLAKVVELASRKVLWSYNISRKQGMIVAVALSNNQEYSVLLLAKNVFKEGAFIFTHPQLVVLNRSGKIMQEISVEGESFYTPALRFSGDHQYIILGLKDSYRIYGIVANEFKMQHEN